MYVVTSDGIVYLSIIEPKTAYPIILSKLYVNKIAIISIILLY